jgi:glycerol-3-phosphate acyltransferase PlsY
LTKEYRQLRPVLVIILAYLLGSIPFGYLIVRAKEGGDIRETGSGGTGATNVSRRAGKAAGVLTLLLDVLKGAAAVLIAMWWLNATTGTDGSNNSNAWLVAAAAIAVMVGHIFPVWLKFRGGKGVATGVGVFLVLMPAVVGIAAFIFVAIVLLTRYVSLASMVAAASIPLLALLRFTFVSADNNFAPLITSAVFGATLILLAHRKNVVRLIQGQESKFR